MPVAQINQYFKTKRLIARAKLLRSKCEAQDSLEDVVEEVRAERKFSLVQKRSEIISFVGMVEELKPKVIVDIGSSGGGTIRLFSHFADTSARILSIDLNNTPIRQSAFKHLVTPSQSITVFQGSSYDEATITFLKDWLKGEKIDLLFIDGDHEYDGVAKDFHFYSPFVRSGGLVAFHDIVEDFKTRYGKETPAYVGEVPKFWREIKEQHSKTLELIQDPKQDGFGIGVIRW